MMDPSDVIIIGAGHNGLILACYLARAGLKVTVFERRLEAGGGLTTEEITLPGFYHNLHSFFHDLAAVMPAMKDLELERFGVRYLRPPVQVGLPLADGRALVIHGDLEATCHSIARFSERDARAYRDLHQDYAEFIELLVLPALFSPPAAPSHAYAALEKSPQGRRYLQLCRRSPLEVVEDLFESEAVRAAVLFQLAIPRGVLFDYAGLGMLVPLVASHAEQSHVCAGGSHVLAHGLWRCLLASGGALRGVHEVKRILIEDGRAVGVEVMTGTGLQEARAKRAVVSAVDAGQTFLELVGPELLPEDLRARVRQVRLDEFSIFGVHLALKEPPVYSSQAFDPDLAQALKVAVGLEDVSEIQRVFQAVRAGLLPEPGMMFAAVPTRFDPSQAPAGFHTALLWQPAPYALKDGGPERWDRIGEEYADRCLARWASYAPNLPKAILARRVLSPLDIERKLVNMRRGGVFMARTSQDQIEAFRPLPELADYRTPIPGLYLCGACTHPGGGITGGPAFNALQILTEDLNINRWWEQ